MPSLCLFTCRVQLHNFGSQRCAVLSTCLAPDTLVVMSSACCVCQSGEWREDMTAKIPTADAPPELHEGVEVQLSNGLQATVAEVTDDHVVIDANHGLAGKDLNFEVELIKLQKVICHAVHATSIQSIHVLVCAYCMVIMCSVMRRSSSKHCNALRCFVTKQQAQGRVAVRACQGTLCCSHLH